MSFAAERESGSGVLATAAAFGAVSLSVIALARSGFLPFVDLPQHIALARLLADIDDPALSRLFEASLFPQVNVLGLLVLAALLKASSETAAAVSVLVIYFSGLAWSLRRLAIAVDGSVWGAVAALLFAVNFNLWYGFISFCLGIPVMIYIFSRLSDPRVSPRRAGALAEAALWLLLLLAHALLFAFALAAAAIWVFVSRRPVRVRILRVLSVSPALVWLCAWWVAHGPVSGSDGLLFQWHTIAVKLEGLGLSTIVASTEERTEWLVLAAVALLAILLAVPPPREAAPRPAGGARPQVRGEARRAARDDPQGERRPLGAATESVESGRMRCWVRLVSLLAAALYFFLPYSVVAADFETRGVFLLYNRFLVIAPLLFLPTLAWPRVGRLGRWLPLAVVALHVAFVWHLDALVRSVAAESEGLDGAVSAMAPRGIVKSLIYTPYPDALQFPSFLHAASYYQARRLGECDQSFAILPDTPVHYRDPDRPYLSRHDEHLAPHLFDWSQAGFYDYVLVYDRGGAWRRFYFPAPCRKTYEENGWIVFEVEARGP